MTTFEFTNINDGEVTEIEAEGFEHACHLLFGQGDEYDLDPKEWELTDQF